MVLAGPRKKVRVSDVSVDFCRRQTHCRMHRREDPWPLLSSFLLQHNFYSLDSE